MKQDIHDQARGKWRGILMGLGVPSDFLKDKHGPCPLCEGKDRFRWDNKDGKGTYICNQCGSGSGIDLLMNYRGWQFREAVDQVRGVVGGASVEPVKPELSDERRRYMLRELWKSCSQTVRGDVVDRYLAARGVNEDIYPASILTCERCYFSQGVEYPAMIGVVSDLDGKPVTLHRTYLGEGAKAPVDDPRRVMPGKIPNGSAIRIGVVQEEIGIAEGIETALAAMQRYELPVWSAINSTMLQNWYAPKGVTTVYIFGDNDRSFGGQAAAYTLAKRLRAKGLTVHVKIPDQIGTDWADYTKGI